IIDKGTASKEQVVKDRYGVTVTLAGSEVRKLRIQFYADDIVRVTATPQSDFADLPDYLMVNAKPAAVSFDMVNTETQVQLRTRALEVRVDLASGKISYFDRAGNPISAEANRGRFGPVIDEPGP